MEELESVRLCVTWYYYPIAILITGVFIRVSVKAWGATEPEFARHFGDNKWTTFKYHAGWRGDYLLSFCLGLLELVAYAHLFEADLVDYVGAWLLFKTVHRVVYDPRNKIKDPSVADATNPESGRGRFNRYLMGNALVLMGGYALASLFLKSTGSTCLAQSQLSVLVWYGISLLVVILLIIGLLRGTRSHTVEKA